jgi:cystathionine beta-lyase
MSNSFKTFLKHTAKDFHNQSVNPPIVRASTIIFKSMQDIRKTQDKAKKNPIGGHFDYGRQGTSTTHILQQILSKLEESYFTFLTPYRFWCRYFLRFLVSLDQVMKL